MTSEIGLLLTFVRTSRGNAKNNDVTVDLGGGDNRTLEHFSAPGDDTFPLPSDYVAVIDQRGSGRRSAIGYLDPNSSQKAVAGDKRIYARDSSGAEIVELWLQNDGTAVLSNANGSVTLSAAGAVNVVTPASTFDCNVDGSIAGNNGNGEFELQAGGDFVVNGATIAVDGTITSPVAMVSPSMVVNGKELDDHDHDILSGSSSPGPTGGNN